MWVHAGFWCNTVAEFKPELMQNLEKARLNEINAHALFRSMEEYNCISAERSKEAVLKVVNNGELLKTEVAAIIDEVLSKGSASSCMYALAVLSWHYEPQLKKSIFLEILAKAGACQGNVDLTPYSQAFAVTKTQTINVTTSHKVPLDALQQGQAQVVTQPIQVPIRVNYYAAAVAGAGSGGKPAAPGVSSKDQRPLPAKPAVAKVDQLVTASLSPEPPSKPRDHTLAATSSPMASIAQAGPKPADGSRKGEAKRKKKKRQKAARQAQRRSMKSRPGTSGPCYVRDGGGGRGHSWLLLLQ